MTLRLPPSEDGDHPRGFAYTGKPRVEGKPAPRYYPSPGLLGAANAALALGAPLLLLGEAGCGKTEFAYAAASFFGQGPPLRFQVRSDARAKDLLYRYDAVARFGESQLAAAIGQARAALHPDDPAARAQVLEEQLESLRDVHSFIRLEALGRAIVTPSERPQVVLIDEIDKAPRDMPNDLLMELEHLHTFDIDELPHDPAEPGAIHPDKPRTWRRTMTRPEGGAAPLVVLTSNVERQLPDAFLRRCVFHFIELPEDSETLGRILRAHHGDGDGELLSWSLQTYRGLRARDGWAKKPGLSELIAWVGALRARPDRGAVKDALQAHHNKQALDWQEFPEGGCLVKMKDDLRLLASGPKGT